MPKNNTVVYKTEGIDMKVTIDGTDTAGNSTHNEWTGQFDGKDYPVKGDPSSDFRSYKRVGIEELDFTVKKENSSQAGQCTTSNSHIRCIS